MQLLNVSNIQGKYLLSRLICHNLPLILILLISYGEEHLILGIIKSQREEVQEVKELQLDLEYHLLESEMIWQVV